MATMAIEYTSDPLASGRSIPLGQATAEIPVEISSEIRERLTFPSDDAVYIVDHPSEEDAYTIPQRSIVVARIGSQYGNEVFRHLSAMPLSKSAAAKLRRYKGISGVRGARKRKNLVRNAIRFIGAVQQSASEQGQAISVNSPHRNNVSAVFAGLYPLLNPYPKAIESHVEVVLDVHDPFPSDTSHNQTRQEFPEFGRFLYLPFLRPFNPKIKEDRKHVIGRVGRRFDPKDGPVMQVHLYG